jgi:hypothetical protein
MNKTLLLLFSLVAVALTQSSLAAGQAERIRELFSPSIVLRTVQSAPAEPEIMRSRSVQINSEVLQAAVHQPGDRIRFLLFDGRGLTGVIDKVENRAADNFTLFGHVEQQPLSTFALSVNAETVVGSVQTVDLGSYQVRYVGQGIHEIRELNPSRFPRCGVAPDGPPAGVAPADVIAEQAATDSDSVIDVMVVYTPAARVSAGGITAMQALINLAVDKSNWAFELSQIRARLRLVYQGEVDYREGPDSGTDLERLIGRIDGYMDEVHTLRDLVGADTVTFGPLWSCAGFDAVLTLLLREGLHCG